MTTHNISKTEQSLVLESFQKKKKIADLSIAMLKFQVLPKKEIDITINDNELTKQVILIAPRESVLLMPNGKRIFIPNKLNELEEYVKSGLRTIRTIQNDSLWAILIGLSGMLGLVFAWAIPRLRMWRDRTKVNRFMDENGDIVYIAKNHEGRMAHLISVNSDRKWYIIHESMASAMSKMGHYVIRLTYPASAVSWQEVLGLEIDPKVEIILDPVQN